MAAWMFLKLLRLYRRKEIMKLLTRWNQLNELENLPHRLPCLFSGSSARWLEQQLHTPQWIPLAAVSENARAYVLKVELPQVKQEDVKITIEDGMLTISGDRKFDLNRRKNHLAEHACGRFAHTFTLPADARPPRVGTVFKNGVLIVHAAKNHVIRRQRVDGNGSMGGTLRETHGLALSLA